MKKGCGKTSTKDDAPGVSATPVNALLCEARLNERRRCSPDFIVFYSDASSVVPGPKNQRRLQATATADGHQNVTPLFRWAVSPYGFSSSNMSRAEADSTSKNSIALKSPDH